ncbi:MAG: hypothetical protein K6F29_00110 [Bacteroidales bacterium]|nr:hypothetical protein [Bacteroidales bacterium]MCR5553918.1 hypothetical protein [Bacteroidales bacterium]
MQCVFEREKGNEDNKMPDFIKFKFSKILIINMLYIVQKKYKKIFSKVSIIDKSVIFAPQKHLINKHFKSTSMKKLLALLVVAGMTFVACNNATEEEVAPVEEEAVVEEEVAPVEEEAVAEMPAEEADAAVEETPAE